MKVLSLLLAAPESLAVGTLAMTAIKTATIGGVRIIAYHSIKETSSVFSLIAQTGRSRKGTRHSTMAK